MKGTNDMQGKRYKVVGNDRDGYAVLDPEGAIEYDLLESANLAYRICALLNSGGHYPTWEHVQAALEQVAPKSTH